MQFKTIMKKIHLWLGIPAGLLVFIISVTGCLYAFQDEIQNLTQPYRFVQAQNKAFLPPSQLQAIAQAQLPDKHLHSVHYKQPNQAAEVIFYHYEPTYYYTIYLNPYTGEVLKVKNQQTGFFRVVLNGHFYLWLPPKIGQPLVAYSTLVFVVLLITGLVLWWPRRWNRSAMRGAFKVNLKSGFKKLNYDLHNVLGFYALLVLLVIALTGLVWGFNWYAYLAYKGAGGEKSLIYADPGSVKADSANVDTLAIDKVFTLMQQLYPTAKSIEVHPPETDSATIAANANMASGTYWQTDYRYFNQYTLAEIPVNHIYGRLADAQFADKMLRMNYDIHTGAIAGLPGKILVFLAGLIAASLPVTGFYIWYKKLR